MWWFCQSPIFYTVFYTHQSLYSPTFGSPSILVQLATRNPTRIEHCWVMTLRSTHGRGEKTEYNKLNDKTLCNHSNKLRPKSPPIFYSLLYIKWNSINKEPELRLSALDLMPTLGPVTCQPPLSELLWVLMLNLVSWVVTLRRLPLGVIYPRFSIFILRDSRFLGQSRPQELPPIFIQL